MPSKLSFFCEEWRAARRVVVLDGESQYELLRTLGQNGGLDGTLPFVEHYGLQGWRLDLQTAAEEPNFRQLVETMGPDIATDVGGRGAVSAMIQMKSEKNWRELPMIATFDKTGHEECPPLVREFSNASDGGLKPTAEVAEGMSMQTPISAARSRSNSPVRLQEPSCVEQPAPLETSSTVSAQPGKASEECGNIPRSWVNLPVVSFHTNRPRDRPFSSRPASRLGRLASRQEGYERPASRHDRSASRPPSTNNESDRPVSRIDKSMSRQGSKQNESDRTASMSPSTQNESDRPPSRRDRSSSRQGHRQNESDRPASGIDTSSLGQGFLESESDRPASRRGGYERPVSSQDRLGALLERSPSASSRYRVESPMLTTSKILPRPLSPFGGVGGRLRRPAPSSALLFMNPQHPLADFSGVVSREEFVTLVRKRLAMPRLFDDKRHIPSPGESVLTSEDAEDLFEMLNLLQQRGIACSSMLSLGKSLDEAVDMFFVLRRLRPIVERGASNAKAFFDALDLSAQGFLQAPEFAHFLKNAAEEDTRAIAVALSADGAEVNRIAETLVAALDVSQDKKVQWTEMQRQIAIVSVPRLTMLEVMGRLQMKYGFGKSGLVRDLDQEQLYAHLVAEEGLDLAPDTFCMLLRLWDCQRPRPANMYSLDAWMRDVPIALTWGISSSNLVDLLYDALGARVLQVERSRKSDACMPPEALLRFDTVLDAEQEKALESAFRALFDRTMCQATDVMTNPCLGQELQEACLQRFIQQAHATKAAMERQQLRSQAMGSTFGNTSNTFATTSTLSVTLNGNGSIGGAIAGALPTPEKEETLQLPPQPTLLQIRNGLRSAGGPRNPPSGWMRSLFPNIGDVIAISSTRLHAGQAFVIRYRLMGTTNFWHADHGVLKNEREAIPWPITREVLGDTPFIALVPKGLKWTSAGGGGFYYNQEPFTSVDHSLRADLPKDPQSGLPLRYGTAEIVAPSLSRLERAFAPRLERSVVLGHVEPRPPLEEFEVRLFCSRKHKIVACIGTPLEVTVIQLGRPPPMATLQARCSGSSVTLRWRALVGDPENKASVERTCILIKQKDQPDKVMSLEPELSELQLHDLLPDTEYEFRARLENRLGVGNEAKTVIRTNRPTSAPYNAQCVWSTVTEALIRWNLPETLGNEATKDNHQVAPEQITYFQATLRFLVRPDEISHEPPEISRAKRKHRTIGTTVNISFEAPVTIDVDDTWDQAEEGLDFAEAEDAPTGAPPRRSSYNPHDSFRGGFKRTTSVGRRGSLPNNSEEDKKLVPSKLEISWPREDWQVQYNSISCKVENLYPDTCYEIVKLTAVNSMGPGECAKALLFWTLPQAPVIANVLVTQGEVLVGLSEVGGVGVKEYHVWVGRTGAGEDAWVTITLQTARDCLRLPLPGPSLPEHNLPELVMPFADMPAAEMHETHSFRIRAVNAGGSSEESPCFETVAIARQQGADHAQAMLIAAIKARELQELSRVLQGVRDIEFDDDSFVGEAYKLKSLLQGVHDKLNRGIQARDPRLLRVALAEARKEQVPHLEQAEELCEEISSVHERLNCAQGIVALRDALELARAKRLPESILAEAADRLAAREEAEEGLQKAMKAARVLDLQVALQKGADMQLPSENQAKEVLLQLEDAEAALKEALQTRNIEQLQNAMQKTETSGLAEYELIDVAKELLTELLSVQAWASERLRQAIPRRHPAELEDALTEAVVAQVPESECEEARVLLRSMYEYLERIEQAVGVDERTQTVNASLDAGVPEEFLAIATKQLQCLNDVSAALRDGNYALLLSAVKLAHNAGVRPGELAAAKVALARWSILTREIEVATAVNGTERLGRAINMAKKAGLNQATLQPALDAHQNLQWRDASAASLLSAMEERRCELLFGSLREAANSEAINLPVQRSAHRLLDRLWGLRAKVQAVLGKSNLRSVFEVLKVARSAPALPGSELALVEHTLADECIKEQNFISQQLADAIEANDAHAWAYALERTFDAAEYGAEFRDDALRKHSRRLATLQEQATKTLHQQIKVQLLEGDGGAGMSRVQTAWLDSTALPLASVDGGFEVAFRSPGTLLCVLPAQLVEGSISVPLPDKLTSDTGSNYDTAHVSAAMEKFQELWETFCLSEREGGAVRAGDVVNHCKDPRFMDDGVHVNMLMDFTIHILNDDYAALDVTRDLYHPGESGKESQLSQVMEPPTREEKRLVSSPPEMGRTSENAQSSAEDTEPTNWAIKRLVSSPAEFGRKSASAQSSTEGLERARHPKRCATAGLKMQPELSIEEVGEEEEAAQPELEGWRSSGWQLAPPIPERVSITTTTALVPPTGDAQRERSSPPALKRNRESVESSEEATWDAAFKSLISSGSTQRLRGKDSTSRSSSSSSARSSMRRSVTMGSQELSHGLHTPISPRKEFRKLARGSTKRDLPHEPTLLEWLDGLLEAGQLSGDDTCLEHLNSEKVRHILVVRHSAYLAARIGGGPPPLEEGSKPEILAMHLQRLRPRQLRRLRCACEWRSLKGASETVEMICCVYDRDRLVEVVTPKGARGAGHVQWKGPIDGLDNCVGAVRFGSDECNDSARTIETSMDVRLDFLPNYVVDLVFAIQVSGAREISKFSPFKLKIVDFDSNNVFASMNVTTNEAEKSDAYILCSLSRSPTDNLWRVFALDVTVGFSRDYGLLMNKLLSMGFPRDAGMRNKVPVILDVLKQQLALSTDPKSTTIVVDEASTLKADFAIEVFNDDKGLWNDLIDHPAEVERALNMAFEGGRRFGSQILDSPPGSFAETFGGLLIAGQPAVSRTIGDALSPRCEELVPGGQGAIRLRASMHRCVSSLRVEMRWDFPPKSEGQRRVSQLDDMYRYRYQDRLYMSAHSFQGSTLQEVVDHRGTHGVRLVFDGTLDYKGIWVGPTGVADATGGAVRYIGEDIDPVNRKGKASIDVNLSLLPPGTTAVYFVLSAPTPHGIGEFPNLQATLIHTEVLGHIIAHSDQTILNVDVSKAPSMIMGRLHRSSKQQSIWRFETTRTLCQGGQDDYRDIIKALRVSQQQNVQKEMKKGMSTLLHDFQIQGMVSNQEVATVNVDRRPMAHTLMGLSAQGLATQTATLRLSNTPRKTLDRERRSLASSSRVRSTVHS